MADVLKVLGQSNPSATTNTDLYTVPSLTQTTTSSLVVCELAGGTPSFRVAIRPGGASLSNEHYIYHDKALTANGSVTAVLGMTLAEGDVVTVYASDGNVSFNLFGVETS